MKDTFRALAGRDFRFYFVGQVVSLLGTWVQQVAMAWITYQVTGSAFMLGVIAFSGQVPTLLLSPIGTQTLATQFWSNSSSIAYGAAAPYAAMMILISLPATFLLTREARRSTTP